MVWCLVLGTWCVAFDAWCVVLGAWRVSGYQGAGYQENRISGLSECGYLLFVVSCSMLNAVSD